MGKVRHVPLELLSALADGELGGSEEREARQHVVACSPCAAELAAFAALDASLTATPAVPCAASLELRSALVDREADPAEARIVAAHLASCAGCRSEQAGWRLAETAIAALPAGMPSAATDTAIAAMTRSADRERPRIWPPSPVQVGLRGAIAAAVVVAILVGLIPGERAAPKQAAVPELAPAPQGKTALVAGVQLAVIHSKSNTLYLLRSSEGAVDAVDPTTYALRTQIAVGGRPTALALSEADDRILVLDSTAKTLTEIDPSVNRVVATIRVDVPGTPTSVQVDETNGKIIVGSVIAPPAAGPAPTPAATPGPAGQVTIIDTETRRIEQIKSIDVAPRLVVPDPSGKQTLLVSPGATTVVDASYNTIQTLPGGIAAAFDLEREWFAILSAEGTGSVLTFVGEAAPAALSLEGPPAAVTSMPDGGFAVLVEKGDGGRIYVVDTTGRGSAFVDVTIAGPDLEYDASAKRFTVAREGLVASAPLPGVVAVESPAPVTSAQPQPSASASPDAPATAAPSTSAEPAATPEPSASPAPIPTQQPQRAAVVVPGDVIDLGGGLYRLPLPAGMAPVITTTTATHVWFVDVQNSLNTLDIESGSVYRIAQLPGDASIRALGVGPDYLYAADVATRRLFLLDLETEMLSSVALPAVDVSAMTVSPGGVAWIAMPGSSQLLSFRPLSKRFEVTDVGATGIVALEADNAGRVWFSTQDGIGYYDYADRKVASLAWTQGRAHLLLAGARGTLWVATARGLVYSVKEDAVTFEAVVGGPAAALALDAKGRPWYLVFVSGLGFGYGGVSGHPSEAVVPGPAVGLALNSQGRAWLADPAGGFYLGVGDQR